MKCVATCICNNAFVSWLGTFPGIFPITCTHAIIHLYITWDYAEEVGSTVTSCMLYCIARMFGMIRMLIMSYVLPVTIRLMRY